MGSTVTIMVAISILKSKLIYGFNCWVMLDILLRQKYIKRPRVSSCETCERQFLLVIFDIDDLISIIASMEQCDLHCFYKSLSRAALTR